MTRLRSPLASWEGFLLAVLLLIYLVNAMNSAGVPDRRQPDQHVPAVGRKDHRRAGDDLRHHQRRDRPFGRFVMGLAACAFGWLVQAACREAARWPSRWHRIGLRVPSMPLFIVGFGIPSLVVTLATMIAFRGLARVLVEDRGISDFPRMVQPPWSDRA
jgi:rhamnose transport system permease protein